LASKYKKNVTAAADGDRYCIIREDTHFSFLLSTVKGWNDLFENRNTLDQYRTRNE